MGKMRQPEIIWQRAIVLKVRVAVLLAILAVVVILCYIFIPKSRNTLTFITAMVGGAAVLYGGYYAGISVKTATEQARKQESFRVLLSIHSLHLTNLRRFIERKVKNEKDKNMSKEEISPADLHDKIVDNPELLTAVNATFGLWEDISVGIQFGCLDEDLLFYSLAFIIPWHFKMLEFYIREERIREDAHIYVEMQKLAEAWGQYKSLLTGEEYSWPTSL